MTRQRRLLPARYTMLPRMPSCVTRRADDMLIVAVAHLQFISVYACLFTVTRITLVLLAGPTPLILATRNERLPRLAAAMCPLVLHLSRGVWRAVSYNQLCIHRYCSINNDISRLCVNVYSPAR